MLDTGAVTQLVLDTLEDVVLVGDGVAPTEGGWSAGQPNVEEFTPYAVVTFMGARPRTPEMQLARQQAAWVSTFQLRSHGSTRAQCDWVALSVRTAVDGLLKASTSVWHVDFVEWVSLGPMVRNDAVDPPLWSATDSLTFHIVKRGT